ncbi:P-loop containing nucleoside triphosphate hydrolase protein [Pelagophyceae sp. CCMP2097]|nr:P-loop containing nucleoside triphosphate hydrolase protein [Pelagophyceae sp. CCMP2097]
MRHVELAIFLRSMVVNINCTLYDSICRVDRLEQQAGAGAASGWEFDAAAAGKKVHAEDRAALALRRDVLAGLAGALAESRRQRLAASAVAPRLRRLANKYGFQPESTEEQLLEVLAVMSNAQTSAFRCALLEDDPGRRAMQLCRLADASELEVESFADAEREHVKENVVYVSDDTDQYVSPGGVPALRLSRIGSRVVVGDVLAADELLKTSGTQLEAILADEGIIALPSHDAPLAKSPGAAQRRKKATADMSMKRSLKSLREDLADSPTADDDEDESDDDEDAVAEKSSDSDKAPTAPAPAADGDGPRPYPADNELEYLGEVFEGIALHIRLATAKVKSAIKEQSGGGASRSCFFPPPDDGAHRAGARELKAKLRIHESRVETRCRATPDLKPRLLQLQAKLDLDDWEIRVVALLVGRTLSPAIKSLMDGMESSGAVQRLDDSTTVGALLSIFCPDGFRDQVEHRRKFYKGARLIARGVVRVARSRWHSSGSSDLTEQRVELDRRVLDFVVGLDTEINELVEGSELYSPKVDLDDVVLPKRAKARLMQLCEAFDKLAPYAEKTGLFENALPYGAGLIVLLCGPSGTGKTMTVHGVARKLGKRVLQVDFASLRGKQGSQNDDVDADLRGLFREAEMSDAVLFFDECEALFRSRDAGGGSDRLLRAMLQEIERHAGLVFLATNRPAELDEAMHRRISTVIEYAPPTAQQRKTIWATLVRRGKLACADDVDWDAIGVKYELSGGFIKNALLSALLFALHRDAAKPIVRDADIRAGCALQQRGAMHKHHSSLGARESVDNFDDDESDDESDSKRVKAGDRLAKLAVTDDVRDKLLRLASFERQRGVVFGTWGFGEAASASVVLFYGPRGAGKRTLADAVAHRQASSLYKVNARDVLWCDSTSAQNPSELSKRLSAVLDDARLTDSVLLIDGFEYALAQPEQSSGGLIDLAPQLARALGQLARYPGVVILVAHCEEPAAIRLAPDFLRHLSFALPVAKPDSKLRAKIWRAVVPETAPLAPDVDWGKLAKHELLPSSIRRAAFTAAAIASARTQGKGDRCITQADFIAAATSEVKRLRGDHADALDRLFV